MLSKTKVNKTNILNLTQHKTFTRLTGTSNWSVEELTEMYKSIELTTAKNCVREFIFRFLNNCLPINTRTSHFVDNVDRSCTFCILSLGARFYGPAPEETFIHLFLNCPIVQNILDRFMTDFIGMTMPLQDNLVKKYLFQGDQLENSSFNLFNSWTRWILLYLIWSAKCRKRIFSWLTFRKDFLYELNMLLENSPAIEMARLKTNTPMARE